MKTRQEFTEAGEQLFESLHHPGINGIVREGVPAKFMWNLDSFDDQDLIEVDPLQKPPYAMTMSVRGFVTGLAFALASENNEKFDRSIFGDEVDVLTSAIFMKLRRQRADYAMNEAVKIISGARRHMGTADQVGVQVKASIAAVEAERIARDSAERFDLDYLRYEELAQKLGSVGVKV